MRHKCFWATCQNFVYLTTSVFPNRHPINLVTVYSSHRAYHRSCWSFSRQPMNIEQSACNYLIVTPIGSLSQIKTNQKRWRGQLKRIKMRSNGPGKMGLTDPCPWAEKRQAHLLYRSTVNKRLRENKDPTKGARLNEGFLYRRMTCPPRLGFLKWSPIRKELGLQGSKANPHYYKNPNTLSHQGTRNLPFSSTLELWEKI